MGFPGYFLIVMDFIKWAKNNGVPVGPGRGSGAGSLVAYVQKITDLDPLAYDLLFERFLNPERVSMPDFDVDFCMDGRDRVIDYVAEKYGRNAVSQIITFGTMAAKAVVRDVARAQGKSYGLADRLSKMIPFEVGMTLEKAYEMEEPLRDFLKVDEDAREIWEMSLKLEGICRGTGKHAGGVVIAPTKLTDFSPIACDDEGGGLVTQFDKDDVESAGLVKFDFLGLRTLTIIKWAMETINREQAKQGLPDLNIDFIPLDDKATFAMLQKAETTAVFQLESRGMKELIKKLKPDCLEDMIALVALFRPGPLQSGMVDDFINRKHGREPISYPHQDYQYAGLEPVLKPTYGIILYQEQVMQIAQVMAGYTLGGADMLRRAMGKKKPEEMAKQRGGFIEGCATNGIDANLAGNIFDLVEKFAGYGFNKSHSAAYGLLSYQTAWLKAHHSAAFMAAVLSADMHNTDKVVTLIEECRSMKVGLTAICSTCASGWTCASSTGGFWTR
jgi:DNA polymerase III subunit alpha